ncbi:MAG: hypothetical protein LBN04_01805 [Oscillospiraceae bacterium]|nr:hypothetical protein [Oscillospiraceae bacterium]
MNQQDTVKLLRECDAGIQMGLDALDDVFPHINSEDLRETVSESRRQHRELRAKANDLLADHRAEGKQPPAIAETMAHLKTKLTMMTHPTDGAIAELIADGSHMGAKSLNRYLNQYKAADEASKDIAKKLIALEDQLLQDTRQFL